MLAATHPGCVRDICVAVRAGAAAGQTICSAGQAQEQDEGRWPVM